MDTKSLTGAALIKEMERRANDVFQIYNPLETDFITVWNGYKWPVPNKNKDIGHGKGITHFPRYLAQKAAREIVDQLIMMESDKLVEEAKRKYNGADWHHEEERIALRTNNPMLRKKYMALLNLTKVSDYGMAVEQIVPEEKEWSGKTVDEELFDELTENVATEQPKDDFLDQIKK